MPKKQAIAPEYIAVCPRCGSKNVCNDLSRDMLAWGGSDRMLCNECGYSAITFPEIEKSQFDEYKVIISHRTKEEKEIIGQQSVSKGFSNKKVNKLFLLYYLLAFMSAATWIFYEGYIDYNYFLIVLGGLVFLGCIFILLRWK